MNLPIERVLQKLNHVIEKRGSWMALCPAHDDHQPSLSIRQGKDDCVLLKCFAGCKVQTIVEALDLQMADLFLRRGRR